MRRRDLMFLLGGAAIVGPRAARAQQSTMPVIGFLGTTASDQYGGRLDAFHQGLKEAGYVAGRNVAIEYRWAENQVDRLPALAAELVQRRVSVIAAGGGTLAALAAKAATTSIPIVFAVASDPVEDGLVVSLSRPGGNLTGIANQNAEVGPKRLEMLHELLPKATAIGVLVNPANPKLSGQFLSEVRPVAASLGMELHVLQASNDRDLDAAFATLAEIRAEALIVGPDVFFNSHSAQIAERALRLGLPAAYQYRGFVVAGGLMSYGASETEYYRLFGGYVGKILDGKKPADLPVVQSTKVELLINIKTANTFGIAVPSALSGRADELIE